MVAPVDRYLDIDPDAVHQSTRCTIDRQQTQPDPQNKTKPTTNTKANKTEQMLNEQSANNEQ
jgi:hypothetical protein